MNIYVIRHAEATPIGGTIVRDADRLLSEEGEAHARLAGVALALLDPSIKVILTSPLARAQQTGALFAKAFAPERPVRPSENLLPGFRYASLLEELTSYGTGGSVAAVGHLPDLANFISWLIADGSHTSVAMSPGSIAHISIDAGSQQEGTLRGLLTPEVIAALHR
jgi:phosphohistidine phosphatase